MKPFSQWELLRLRKQHFDALSGKIPASWKIRKGWEVRDDTEPNGRRLLTDEEITAITEDSAR